MKPMKVFKILVSGLYIATFLTLPAAFTASPASAFYHTAGTEEKAVADGSVTIKSPEEGSTIGESVEVLFDFEKGKRGDHVHLFLDGELLGPVYGKKYTIDDLSKGEHTIEVKLTTKNHVLLGPEAKVTVKVE